LALAQSAPDLVGRNAAGRTPDVFLGAISGLYQLGTPANTADLRASGRVGLMMSTLGLYHLLFSSEGHFRGSTATGRAVVRTFAGTGGGLLEGNEDGATTPSLPQYRLTLGVANGSARTFSASAAGPVSPKTLQIVQDTTVVARDDGHGMLTGAGGTGSVSYTTGSVSFSFGAAPPSGSTLRLGFNRTTPYKNGAAVPAGAEKVWNYDRPDTWQSWIRTVGWHPTVFLMNVSGHGKKTVQDYSDLDVADQVAATHDIKRADPEIRYVLPYLSPNGGRYDGWASSSYWANSRKLALQQKGFAIDVPVGYFLNNSDAYRKVVLDEIRWAQQNRLIVYVLLSPYSTNSADCTVAGTCQFSPDPHFMASAQEVVRRIHAGGSDPTGWIVDNYSEQSVSPQIGTDDTRSAKYDQNTIAAVANWIARHASTSPYPQAD